MAKSLMAKVERTAAQCVGTGPSAFFMDTGAAIRWTYDSCRRPVRSPISALCRHKPSASASCDMQEAYPRVNFILDDPTALVPGSDLPGREWSLLNRFRSGTGRCAASLHQCMALYGQITHCASVVIDTQSMSHIVNDCQVNKFEAGLAALHIVSDSAREWLCRVNCIR